MFTFAITPENRVAVETILLIVCALAAMFIARPAKQTVTAPATHAVTGD